MSQTSCCTSHVIHHTSNVKRHTSHITHHTSHITRHTSHVTRHTSHVTHHTSHVTPDTRTRTHHPTPADSNCVAYHMLHVTRQTQHFTHHTSHVTRHLFHRNAMPPLVGGSRHMRANCHNFQVKMPKQRQQPPPPPPPRQPKRIVRLILSPLFLIKLALSQVPQQKFPVRRPALRADAMDIKNQVQRVTCGV